jgi:hypothetical protein
MRRRLVTKGLWYFPVTRHFTRKQWLKRHATTLFFLSTRSVTRIILDGCTNFPTIQEPSQNSRCHKSDMKQGPYFRPANIKRHRAKVSSPGDLEPGSCVPPFISVLYLPLWNFNVIITIPIFGRFSLNAQLETVALYSEMPQAYTTHIYCSFNDAVRGSDYSNEWQVG